MNQIIKHLIRNTIIPC